MDKPDVDSIEAFRRDLDRPEDDVAQPPLDRGTVTRSTTICGCCVAVGKPHCPICGRPIVGQSASRSSTRSWSSPTERASGAGPRRAGRKGEYGKLLEEMRADGFTRVKIDDRVRMLEESIVLDKRYKHDIAVVVDRLIMRHDVRARSPTRSRRRSARRTGSSR